MPLDKIPSKDYSSQEKLFQLIQLTLIGTIIILAVWLIGNLLLIIFAATLIGIILKKLSSLVRKYTHLPYWLALTIVVISIIILFSALIWSSGPQIGEQINRLRHTITAQTGTLHDRLQANSLGRIVLDYLPSSIGSSQSDPSKHALGSNLAGSMTGFITSVFGVIGTLFVIFMAGLYFALSPTQYGNGLLRLFPKKNRLKAKKLLLITENTLWAWTAGQSLDMLVVGLFSFIGLSIIGIPLAMGLGVIAGLANFIPYIGAIIGAVPAILVGLSQGTKQAILVAILYGIIQFLEGNVFAPLIQKRAVKMPPAITILSQTIFGTILGMPGLILASPLTAATLAIAEAVTSKLSSDEEFPPLD